MRKEKRSGNRTPIFNPSHKLCLIGMPRVASDRPDPRLNGDRTTRNEYPFRAIKNGTPKRACSLKSHEEDRRIRSRQIVPKGARDWAYLTRTERLRVGKVCVCTCR